MSFNLLQSNTMFRYRFGIIFLSWFNSMFSMPSRILLFRYLLNSSGLHIRILLSCRRIYMYLMPCWFSMPNYLSFSYCLLIWSICTIWSNFMHPMSNWL